MRKQVLTSFIHFDLLDKQVFESLFFSKSAKVREYLVSLINNLASEYQGRTYLISIPDIVKLLSNQLFKETQDSYLRQNALGTLKKFSLRKAPQSCMIECNVIP
jgi:hypothetical protein